MQDNRVTRHNSEKDIAKAQRWLRNLGSAIKVTGVYTIGMTTALNKYQRSHNMDVTGILDDDTWKQLRKDNPWWKKLLRK